jgi:FkbM family methyltransferase
MRIVSNVLPLGARNRLRRAFDSFYCQAAPDKETIGTSAPWTIVTRDMRPDAAIYSGGVGGDISFEEELIRRFGVRVHIFDPSEIALRTIEQANNDHLLFHPVGLAASTQANVSVGGGEGDKTWLKAGGLGNILCTTLPAELKKNGHTSIDLLKIDIEGFEYEVLENCLSAHIPIKQICVEFHDFYPEIPKKKTSAMIETLRSNGFELIHRHRHDHTFLKK